MNLLFISDKEARREEMKKEKEQRAIEREQRKQEKDKKGGSK